jgi:hypothetical protein
MIKKLFQTENDVGPKAENVYEKGNEELQITN